MDYYLGMDIGTSSAKAVAFSSEGKVLERRAVSYGMRHPAPDRSEQDPDEIYRAVCKCLEEVVAALKPGRPLLVSFSAAMHSLLAVDARGNPLTACMIWADNRAAAIAEELKSSETGKSFYQLTGVPIHPMSPLCKLLWLRQEEPAIFYSAARFIGIKEYILFKLSGEYLVDSSIASATGLLNLRTLQWDEAILRYLSIDASKLARVVSPRFHFPYGGGKGELTTSLSLPAGTPIVPGASDGALANIATGATGEQKMAVTIGTSGAARMASDRILIDGEMRTFCYHVKDDHYICGGATNNGAVVIQWLKESLLQATESYEELLLLAGTTGPGADGLLFIPYILGERAPIWNSKARGIYFGLDIHHGKAHLVRAAMEGVIYCLYDIGRILSPGLSVRELHASGGFARSPLWLQILADVFMVKVLAFGNEDSSALGAVLVGMEALGGFSPFPHETPVVYEPDAAAHALYAQRFEQFLRVYALVKGEFY